MKSQKVSEVELRELSENFDHLSELFRDNRLDFYHYIHQHHIPVRHSRQYGGFWYVPRYESALAIQRNPEVYSNKRFTIPERPVPPLIPATMDPPEHSEFKKLLVSFFTPKSASRLIPRLTEIARQRISSGIAQGKFDMVQDVMLPLMAEFTMTDVLGLDVGNAFDYAQPVHNMTRRDYPHDKAAEELRWLGEKLDEDICNGRLNEKGILCQLAKADFNGRHLTGDELRLIAINLLIGGMGTTSFFMGSVAVFLGRNPKYRDQLIRERGMIPNAIEELLRVFGPVQSFGRSVKVDTQVEGIQIKKGEKVLVGYGAANFDPDVFVDPQVIDFLRKPNQHMSFGLGPHRCLGAHIAREVVISVTSVLLDLAPQFRLIEEEIVEQDPMASMLGFNHVPVFPGKSHYSELPSSV